ncbi:MAG: hypothetical protein NZ853_07425 [Leptospiraceae bacterium]|nr:hypothetical protein [Leptospiraceae bacterium]MDW7975735.1 hypothetical protein [Leptospiraceae bacterium]
MKKKVKKIYKFFKGLSLIEIAFAIAVASTFSISVLNLVSSSYRMQKNSQNLELASTLARIKMNQILSQLTLEPTQKSGELNVELYQGFKYEILIKEEQVDLAKISETGKIEANVDDLLPTSVQNFKGKEKQGQNITETGGLIPIYRIIVRIHYPIGKNELGTYEVQTFKAAKGT